MAHHVPGNMVSASRWCHRCQKKTQHRVDSHVVTNVCLECQEPKSPARELTPIVSAEIPAPCTCKKYPGGHYHAIQRFGEPYYRFKPGTWEESRA